MTMRSMFVYTPDPIGLGEDDPAHQSIEHASSLRLVPYRDVGKPCDKVEAGVAWAAAIERDTGPTCLLFTRQSVPFIARTTQQIEAIHRGGYVLADAAAAKAIIIATGSEVSLAVGAQKALSEQGVPVRVVSMPCTSVFDRQDASYRDSVLPRGLPRLAVEAGVSDYWRKYVGAIDDPRGAVLGIDTFGESAPAGALFKYFGFTVEHVVAAVKNIV